MCPAASPAGPDPMTALVREIEQDEGRSACFARAAACRIVGLTLPELEAWERALGDEAGLRLATSLTFADVLALAILREASWRLGASVTAFTLGLGQLFEILGARPDVERLDSHAALVGRDFARLAELRKIHLRCAGDDFVIVPLLPILGNLRDQVLS